MDRSEYGDLLDCLPTQISPDVNDHLTREVAEVVVRQVAYQLGGSRAPVPDGFSGSFFQRNWNVVDPNIVTSVKSILSIVNLPSFLNQTVITLILKIPSPQCASDFRPIVILDIKLCLRIWKIG